MNRYFIGLLTIALIAACNSPQPEPQTLTVEMANDSAHQHDHQGQQPANQGEFVDEGPEEALLYTPDEIEWEPGPDSLEEDAEMAVLEGDPGEEEVFNMRLRLPDGFRIAPHTHQGVERVTIIEGTFNLGHGEEFDADEATALEAGSYFSIPPGHPHFAEVEGETIIQLKSVGPWVIEYVDPADDPREAVGQR